MLVKDVITMIMKCKALIMDKMSFNLLKIIFFFLKCDMYVQLRQGKMPH